MSTPKLTSVSVAMIATLFLMGHDCSCPHRHGETPTNPQPTNPQPTNPQPTNPQPTNPQCTLATATGNQSPPDRDATAALIASFDPVCATAGRIDMVGQRLQWTATFEDLSLCPGAIDQQSRVHVRQLTVVGEYRLGFNWRPGLGVVIPQCLAAGAAIAALRPTMTFEVRGTIDLEMGAQWVEPGTNIGHRHYEIYNSDLRLDQFNISGSPLDAPVEAALRNELLDRIDRALADEVDRGICACTALPPQDDPTYPVYADAYDPR